MTPQRQRLDAARAALTDAMRNWPGIGPYRVVFRERWAAGRAWRAHLARIRRHTSRRHQARRRNT